MFEKIDLCPICSSKGFSNYIICQDHFLTKESFALVKCDKCGFVFTNPRPTSDNIGKYYASTEYLSHSKSQKGILSTLYNIVKNYSFNSKLKLIKKYSKGNKVLDYGCGAGDFLKYMKGKSFEVTGVEPTDVARNVALNQLGDKVYANLKSLPSNEKFDVITLWHVLEHIHDLNETVQTIRNLLSTTGVLVIAIPNINAPEVKVFKEYWAAYDVPRHLYHFSQNDIKNLGKKHKLKLKSVHPLIFDSYYISLMSNKYLHGSMKYFKSFLEGYRSNKKAKAKNDYSSLIYIFSK